MSEFLLIFLIAIGGFFGGGTRYIISIGLPNDKFRYPIATLFVNIIGSFSLGYLTQRYQSNNWQYIILGIGFMGSFTTFSTFKVENAKYILEGKSIRALEYMLISYAVGIVAAYIGYII